MKLSRLFSIFERDSTLIVGQYRLYCNFGKLSLLWTMGEKIGYARVSTREQNLSSQIDALNNAGCARIFTDKISGKEFKREGLTACLDYLRAGDTLFIYRLDRLGRSVKEMLELCSQLEQRRIKLVSLQDNLDTSTAVGRFTMQILASLAEYNRNLILEGCKAGIEAAKN
mgnify:FL=1